MLVAGGYPDEQIARVVGYASSALFDRKDPFNPINRRIDILVLTRKAQRNIEGEQASGGEEEVRQHRLVPRPPMEPLRRRPNRCRRLSCEND